ncbi:alpha/beta fold hydrolase [Psychrobacillus sp. FSL W7-1457]|uniref:acetylxylan esterase n=1 Tax=unclassified Psychrobacillus TaxID=2636677 RepID=UPI0030F4F355
MGRQIGDYSLNHLKEYQPKLIRKPVDFHVFWEEQKKKISNLQPNVTVVWKDYVIPTMEVADLVFESWDGTPLKGWAIKPKGVEQCPVILNIHGYTGSRGLPLDYLKWISMGIAVYAFDVRAQGSSPDYAKYNNGSRSLGWMLNGIHDPDNYYYTNVLKDLQFQLEWINSPDALFIPTKLGVVGSSQGGGLALAIAGMDQRIELVVSDYPFLANFERALEVSLAGPYMEFINYFKYTDPQYDTYETLMNTLGYIDCVHFCESINCPTLMSIGLEDSVTPPSTVFAAYNHLRTKSKEIEVYPQYAHEVNPFHEEKKLAFVRKHWS